MNSAQARVRALPDSIGKFRWIAAALCVGLLAACAGPSTSDSVAGSDGHRLRSGSPVLAPVTGGWSYTGAAYAGSGNQGFSGDGGQAASAELGAPQAIATSADGKRLFIADTANSVIRQVNVASGVITTIAGMQGSTCNGPAPAITCGDGGPATRAQLNNPSGLALSPDGTTLYIADTGSNRIRALNLSAKVITTAVGTGQIGYGGDNGNATQAMLAGPLDVAVDPSGNLYIADTDNNRVRKVDTSGVITTIAGTATQCPTSSNCGVGGPAVDAQLAGPSGVTYSTAGSTKSMLLIADTNTDTIRSIDSSGTFGTAIGASAQAGKSPDRTPAAQALLNQPRRVSVGIDGTMVVSDTGNQRLLFVTPTGDQTWQATSSGIPVNAPWSAIMTATGVQYADQANNQVLSLATPTGPGFTWNQCGPDAYTHNEDIPDGRVTDTVFTLPGMTSVTAKAWGAAGGAAYLAGQAWPSAPGGAGGYAQTAAPSPITVTTSQTSRYLAVIVGCAGQSYAPNNPVPPGYYNDNPAWTTYGGGGGATTLAALDGYLQGIALPSALVVAGGGGGGSGPNCVQGSNQAQFYIDGEPCDPYQTTANGYAGANGGGLSGQGGSPGQGNGTGAQAPDPYDYPGSSGQSGFGGSGGNSSGNFGWGGQWCTPQTCPGSPGAGGGGGDTGETIGGGGGGGAGGGAGGNSVGNSDGGSGGGSWSTCTDTTQTNSPSQSNGSMTVALGGTIGTCHQSAVVPASIGSATINGNGYVGMQLSASAGKVAGTPSPSSTTYQWSSSATQDGTYTPINGATNSSYTPVPKFAGQYVQVTITVSNGGVASATSSPVLINGSSAAAIAGVTITGTPKVGAQLTATTSGVSGAPAPTLTYQWWIGSSPLAVLVPIPGANSATYTPPASQQGDYLKVTVYAKNGIGKTAWVGSPASAAVAPAG